MKQTKRVVSLILSIGILAGTITGCGQKAADSTSQGDSSTTSSNVSSEAKLNDKSTDDPYAPLKEKTTISLGRSEDANAKYESGETSADNYITKHLSQKLNVDYSQAWVATGDAYLQKVSLIIASGQLPDAMTVNESQLRQLVKAGLIEDMTDSYNKYASDNLHNAYATTGGASLASATFDGKLMAIPNVSPGSDAIPMLYVRDDWMKACNLEAPKTLEDIVNIVKTFKEKNMGKGSTSGLVVQKSIVNVGGNMYGLDAVFALYKSYPQLWVKDDSGKLVYGSITPETKTALSKISELFSDGIIDKDFAVKDSDKCTEIVTSGQAGIFFGPWWNANWPLIDMAKTDPNITWSTYAVPLDDSGKYNTHMMSPTSSYLVVRKGYASPEAIVKTCNYQYDIDQDQGESLKPNAKASYSWTMMPFSLLLSNYNDKEKKAQSVMDVVNGKKQESDLVGEEIQWYKHYTTVTTSGLPAAIEQNMASGWGFTRGAYTISGNIDHINEVTGATYAQTATMDKKWATLKKLEDEIFLQIITGEKSIDEFDAFVSQWKSLGGDTITSELEQMIK